jgi:hypothetical protein
MTLLTVAQPGGVIDLKESYLIALSVTFCTYVGVKCPQIVIKLCLIILVNKYIYLCV